MKCLDHFTRPRMSVSWTDDYTSYLCGQSIKKKTSPPLQNIIIVTRGVSSRWAERDICP